jgi:hypothetical protein
VMFSIVRHTTLHTLATGGYADRGNVYLA